MDLSNRQRMSLGLAMAGRTNREIARVLGTTPAGVRSDLFIAAAKLGVTRRDAMIERARRLHLEDPGAALPEEAVATPGEHDACSDR
ncbi:MAG: LuxR C-terminal-related transcriptional regulator [Dehalococcoidia bacterium]